MKDKTRDSYMEAYVKGPACLRRAEWEAFLDRHVDSLEQKACKVVESYSMMDETELLLATIASVVRRVDDGSLKLDWDDEDQLSCGNTPLQAMIASNFKLRIDDLIKIEQRKTRRLQDSHDRPGKSNVGQRATALASEGGLPSELKAIAERVGAGKSHKQIAEELRITKYQVTKRIDELKGWICSHDPSHPMVIRYRKQQASVSAGVA